MAEAAQGISRHLLIDREPVVSVTEAEGRPRGAEAPELVIDVAKRMVATQEFTGRMGRLATIRERPSPVVRRLAQISMRSIERAARISDHMKAYSIVR